MFPAVCHKFVQSMGPDTLHSVKSLDRATDVHPLSVVVRKTTRRFIFFKKTKHIPYDFKLQDLLMNSDVLLDLPIHSTKFCEFNPTSKYSLSGKLGIQIMHELMDAELSASDTVTVSSQLGEIEMKEVYPEEFLEEISKRKLNCDHTFIQQVREDPNSVLCVVQGVCQVEKDVEIKRITDVDGEIKVDGKVSSSSVSGDIDGKVEREKDQVIVIPAGTPVAYKLWELEVNTATGTIVPQLIVGVKGKFYHDESQPMDVADGPELLSASVFQEDLNRMKEVLKGAKRLDKEKKEKYKSLILDLMQHLSNIELMSEILDELEGKTAVSLKTKLCNLSEATRKTFGEFLKLLDVTEDIQQVPLQLKGEMTPLFLATACLFDALDELSTLEVDLVQECLRHQSQIDLVTHMCENAVLKQQSPQEHNLTEESIGYKLLKHIGFKMLGKQIVSPEVLPPILDEMFCILFVFCNDK